MDIKLISLATTYWELSYDIFDRIEVSVENGISDVMVNYMKENPLIIAKRKNKKVNLKGLVT